MAHRDGAGESQGCVGAMGGPWGVSNTLVHVGGGPLRVGGGRNASLGRAGGHGRQLGLGTHGWAPGGIAAKLEPALSS